MNYQGGTNLLAGTSSTVAGIAVLPNTGEVSLLTYVGIAAIVTGAMMVSLQIGVWVYRLSKSR